VTPERWQQVKERFQVALELRPELRANYLDECCAGDPELRHEIESLLTSHEADDHRLETPAHLHEVAAKALSDPFLGRNIGPYQTISKIGEGGMGAVYRAVRVDDHYLKQVAIKLLRHGLRTEHSLRRFKNERQIMASLDHPNIARLLDGGATDDGHPYFVMEYIEGSRIDAYCDSRKLGTIDRLRLFVDVCGAVQYAHQSLVVHRDLKPANILVTESGVPKLLDFGIAKALEPELFFQTAEPTVMALPMTPEYASPEQVRGEPVTTASDVYSLGVVLYRLLTGHPPYRVDSNVSLLEMARAVSESQPERPSDAVNRVETITDTDGSSRELTPESVSEVRDARPGLLRRKLEGDLDNIVLKALRKEPARRYGSVQQLADDIQHYLDGRPVIARPDTLRYRAIKFVQRNRALVGAAALMVVSLTLGMLATMREARIAREQSARAEHRFNDVRWLANSLLFEVHDSIQQLPGATPARQLIVQNALQYLDSLAKEASGDAALQRELSMAYEKVGDVQGLDVRSNLGDTAGALQSYQKALAIREALVAAHPEDVKAHSDLAEAYSKLGSIQMQMGKQKEALALFRKTLEMRKELAASAGSDDRDAQMNLALAYDGLGDVLADNGLFEIALDNNRDSLSIFESLHEKDPKFPRYRRAISIEHKKIGGVLEASGKLDLALSEYQKALQTDEAMASEDPLNAVAKRDVAITHESIGDVLLKTGDTEGALKAYQRSITLGEALAAADPKDAWAMKYKISNHKKIGDALAQTGDFSGAELAYLQATKDAERRAASDAANASARRDVAEIYQNLGALFYKRALQGPGTGSKKQDLLTAQSWYRKSLDGWRDLREKGELRGIDAHAPDEAAQALVECQNALEHLLGARASSPREEARN
jgi:eukaryotic-like serine/threonine-protein kinase